MCCSISLASFDQAETRSLPAWLRRLIGFASGRTFIRPASWGGGEHERQSHTSPHPSILVHLHNFPYMYKYRWDKRIDELDPTTTSPPLETAHIWIVTHTCKSVSEQTHPYIRTYKTVDLPSSIHSSIHIYVKLAYRYLNTRYRVTETQMPVESHTNNNTHHYVQTRNSNTFR